MAFFAIGRVRDFNNEGGGARYSASPAACVVWDELHHVNLPSAESSRMKGSCIGALVDTFPLLAYFGSLQGPTREDVCRYSRSVSRKPSKASVPGMVLGESPVWQYKSDLCLGVDA